MGKPTFLCIGGQRCGTTRLHRVFDAHPYISMTQAGVDALNKEIHYFDQHVLTQSLGWYESHFPLSGTSGEITPAYSILPNQAVQAISDYLSESKIIFIVRNPLDRIWSQLRMMRSAWGLADMKNVQLQQLVALFDSPAVVLRSDYLQTLQRWQRCFGADRLLVLTFEQALTNVGLRRIFIHIGARSDWLPSEQESQKVFSSPQADIPKELRWLVSMRWLDMLHNLLQFDLPVRSWVDLIEADLSSMPSSFPGRVEKIRIEQSDSLAAKWTAAINHQECLSKIILERVNSE
jgi:hypothetical protein